MRSPILRTMLSIVAGRFWTSVVSPSQSFRKSVVPVTTYDVDENEGKAPLYRIAADGTGSPLTSPDEDATAPAISPDGARVAFLRKHGDDDKLQVHVMRLDGGEAQRITDLPLGTVKNRIFRAREMLRGHLGDLLGAES